MEASVRVILSASVACEAANEAVVAENVRTVSMRARKSLAERVMNWGGGVVWRCSAQLYLTEQWAWDPKSVERQRASKPVVLKLELLEEW